MQKALHEDFPLYNSQIITVLKQAEAVRS